MKHYLAAAVLFAVVPCAVRSAGVTPASRGGVAAPEHLTNYAGSGPPEKTDREARDLEVVTQHIPPLTHSRGDRWPVQVWADTGTTPAHWQAWIDRGISPLFREVVNAKQARGALDKLRYFQDRGVPLVILPQGWVQRAFHHPPAGTGCDHLPPARPSRAIHEEMEPNRDFTCPAWMYDNPALVKHGANATRVCRLLKENGITPVSMWLDFESGAYLRNGAETEDRIQLAAAEARKCPRCRERFGSAAMQRVESYRDIVDAARAYAQRAGFVDPSRAVFPDLHTGNFFAHPIRREPPVAGKHPAYGWQGSGFNVAQPRCYFIPGWGGGGRDPAKVGWNVFRYCIEHFSSCARVLNPDETLVPWVGYLWGHANARKSVKRGCQIGVADAYREMTIHALMRGAETLAIFTHRPPSEALPEEYAAMPRADLGGFVLNVVDIQRGYDTMLAYHDLLRKGRVLNYDVAGAYGVFDKDSTAWSGVGTKEKALVRTVSFAVDQERTIELFGRALTLPFHKQGRFFWIYPDGRAAAVGDGDRSDD